MKRREISWKLFMDFIVIVTMVAVLSSLSMKGYSMWVIASNKQQKLSEKYSKWEKKEQNSNF